MYWIVGDFIETSDS